MLGIVYGFSIVIAIVFVICWYYWYQQRAKEEITAPIAVVTSTQYKTINDENLTALIKINLNCGKYYKNLASGNNPIDKELSDFNNLYPLSDFLCGEYSMVQPKVRFADGRTLHFIAPVFLLDCGGSGHCGYYPLLEEKTGLVRHIRGFIQYDYAMNSTSTVSISQDTDGIIPAWEISYDSSKGTLLVDDTHLGNCGTQNIYKFNAKDEPILIYATNYDCSTHSTTTLFRL